MLQDDLYEAVNASRIAEEQKRAQTRKRKQRQSSSPSTTAVASKRRRKSSEKVPVFPSLKTCSDFGIHCNRYVSLLVCFQRPRKRRSSSIAEAEAMEELDESQSDLDSDDPQLQVVVPKRASGAGSARKRGKPAKSNNTLTGKKAAPEGGSKLHCICRTPYDDTK